MAVTAPPGTLCLLLFGLLTTADISASSDWVKTNVIPRDDGDINNKTIDETVTAPSLNSSDLLQSSHNNASHSGNEAEGEIPNSLGDFISTLDSKKWPKTDLSDVDSAVRHNNSNGNSNNNSINTDNAFIVSDQDVTKTTSSARLRDRIGTKTLRDYLQDVDLHKFINTTEFQGIYQIVLDEAERVILPDGPSLDSYEIGLAFLRLSYLDVFKRILGNRRSRDILPRPSDVSLACYDDITYFIDEFLGVTNATGEHSTSNWAMRMFDAYGKPPPGVLTGALQFVGNYDECLSVHATVPSEGSASASAADGSWNHSREFSGTYCRVQMPVAHLVKIPFMGEPNTFWTSKQQFPLYINWGVCVPDTCSSGDVQALLTNGSLRVLNLPVEQAICYEKPSLAHDSPALATVLLVCFFVLIVTVCSIYDIYVTHGPWFSCDDDNDDNDNTPEDLPIKELKPAPDVTIEVEPPEQPGNVNDDCDRQDVSESNMNLEHERQTHERKEQAVGKQGSTTFPHDKQEDEEGTNRGGGEPESKGHAQNDPKKTQNETNLANLKITENSPTYQNVLEGKRKEANAVEIEQDPVMASDFANHQRGKENNKNDGNIQQETKKWTKVLRKKDERGNSENNFVLQVKDEITSNRPTGHNGHNLQDKHKEIIDQDGLFKRKKESCHGKEGIELIAVNGQANGGLAHSKCSPNGLQHAGKQTIRDGIEDGNTRLPKDTTAVLKKGSEPSTKASNEEGQKDKRASKEGKRKPAWEQVVLGASFYRNLQSLVSPQYSSKTFSSIQGMRAISMAWIVVGHCYTYGGMLDESNMVFQNTMELVETSARLSFHIVGSAQLAVDTFFMISGTLAMLFTLRQIGKQLKSMTRFWLMFLFHRFWRLTPMYMIVLMMGTNLYDHVVDGPLKADNFEEFAECSHKWWSHLLYVNNFYQPHKKCMTWAWFMAVDMQLYVVTPAFIYAVYRNLKVGVCLLVSLLVCGMTAAFLSEFVHGGQFVLMDVSFLEYWSYVYTMPWARVGAYTVGLLLGVVLYHHPERPIMSKRKALAVWIAAFVIGVFLVLINHDQWKPGANHWSRVAQSFYEALVRPVWALCVAWVVYACCTGLGGVANTILGWGPFIVVSRINYSVYLLHPLIIMFVIYSRRTPVYLDPANLSLAYNYMGNLTLTYLFGAFFSLTFEVPLSNLEKVMLGRH